MDIHEYKKIRDYFSNGYPINDEQITYINFLLHTNNI